MSIYIISLLFLKESGSTRAKPLADQELHKEIIDLIQQAASLGQVTK